jgi:hypothetical protein
MGAMKLDAQTVESKFHMAIGCDPLDAEMYAYRHAAQQPCFLLISLPISTNHAESSAGADSVSVAWCDLGDAGILNTESG